MHEHGEFPIGDHPDLTDIDLLAGKLESVPESRTVIGHLQFASSCRRNGKLNQCSQSLAHALTAAQSLPEKTVSEEVCRKIRRLLERISAAEPHSVPEPAKPPEAVKLGEFFNNAEVSFGIFYPKKHVVAVFPSPAQAQRGLSYLRTAGLRVWEAIIVLGEEVLQFLEELQANKVLWSALTKELARLPGPRPSTVECYTRWAERGAGFLIAHSPTDADAEQIRELLGEAGPVAVHWFTSGFIRDMT